MRKPHAAAMVVGAAAALGLAACNTGTRLATPAVTAPAPAASSKAATPTTTPASHVGATLTAGHVYITLTKVIDPAQPATQYLSPDAGDRFVAAEFTIANRGTSVLSGDADASADAVGSNGQTYSPDFSAVAECTNFDYGQFTLAPGDSATGCVTFQVPTGVTVAKVQFTLTQGFSQTLGEWDVP